MEPTALREPGTVSTFYQDLGILGTLRRIRVLNL